MLTSSKGMINTNKALMGNTNPEVIKKWLQFTKGNYTIDIII